MKKFESVNGQVTILKKQAATWPQMKQKLDLKVADTEKQCGALQLFNQEMKDVLKDMFEKLELERKSRILSDS